jgi:hypothetical protein
MDSGKSQKLFKRIQWLCTSNLEYSQKQYRVITQLVGNQSPSIIKAIFWKWSHDWGMGRIYWKMMLESGYKKLTEMWLMYYKWNLRTTCNMILDYSVHTKTWVRMKRCHFWLMRLFNNKKQAEGNGHSKCFSSSVCSYYAGYTEI